MVIKILITQVYYRSDPPSYVVAVTNKAQKKFRSSNGIQTHDLCDTGEMLYQLSYEASLEADHWSLRFFFWALFVTP